MPARHASLETISPGTAFSLKVFTQQRAWLLGKESGILRVRAPVFPCTVSRVSHPFFFACLHPVLLLLGCHWFLAPLFPEVPQPMCSQAQHTLSQPGTSSEAAVHNYNQLLQAAGRQLCKQASWCPECQGGSSLLLATTGAPVEVPTPFEDEGPALPS